MEEPGVKLGYWAIRGLAERIRQLLEYCGVPYSQEVYAGAEGREKWTNADKPRLIEKHPAITLPYLIDEDRIVTESDAICVYICLKANQPELLGRNIDEQVMMATVHGVYKDFHPNYIRLVYGKYDEQRPFENALKESVAVFEPYLKKLHGLLGDKEFMAGGLTWIDFAIADFMQTLDLLSPDLLQPFPKLRDLHQRVWALPQLKDYFASPRFQKRPCNNYTAYWK
jgi:glutathione S-transferase